MIALGLHLVYNYYPISSNACDRSPSIVGPHTFLNLGMFLSYTTHQVGPSLIVILRYTIIGRSPQIYSSLPSIFRNSSCRHVILLRRSFGPPTNSNPDLPLLGFVVGGGSTATTFQRMMSVTLNGKGLFTCSGRNGIKACDSQATKMPAQWPMLLLLDHTRVLKYCSRAEKRCIAHHHRCCMSLVLEDLRTQNL